MDENKDFSEELVESFLPVLSKLQEVDDPVMTARTLARLTNKFQDATGLLNKRTNESDLTQFPRPSVAADVAVLSVIDFEGHPSLVALATRRGPGHEEGTWALPGRMLREHETLDKTANDAVKFKLGIDELELDQLRVFDEPDRDPRGWVLSVAHIATVPAQVAEQAIVSPDVAAIFITDGGYHFPSNQSDLPYEQRQILREAVKELRRRYSLLPDPGLILEDEFTLSQLREVHEAIQDTEIAPDTFRREMLPNLKATGHRAEGSVGKPPMMYRRKDRRESTVRTSRMLSARMVATDDFM